MVFQCITSFLCCSVIYMRLLLIYLVNSSLGCLVIPSLSSLLKEIFPRLVRWAANAERNAHVVAFVKDKSSICEQFPSCNSRRRPQWHSPSGASSAGVGLVIELTNYEVVKLEKRTASVGGSSLWRTVKNEVIKH